MNRIKILTKKNIRIHKNKKMSKKNKSNIKNSIKKYKNSIKKYRNIKGGKVVKLYGPEGITNIVKPRNGSLNSFNKSIDKYHDRISCFNGFKKKFKKCYKKKGTKLQSCKQVNREKSLICQFKPGVKNISVIKAECLDKNIRRKVKCYNSKISKKGSISNLFSLRNPTTLCVRKAQKKIEFCEDNPNDTRIRFERLLREQNDKANTFFGKKRPYLKSTIANSIKNKTSYSLEEILNYLDPKIISELNA